MAIVSLGIGGRFYKFSCNDGQEVHMRELALMLDKKAEQLTKALGVMPEGQLLAMIALLLAEEMYVAQKKEIEVSKEQGQSSSEPPEDLTPFVEMLTQLTGKIQILADNLQK